MSFKKNVAIFGAGKIGKLVVNLLSNCNDYEITVYDTNKENAKKAAYNQISGKILDNVNYDAADFMDTKSIERALQNKNYVLSCAPFYCNKGIAEVARKLKVHYLDLTEDVKTTAAIKELAKNAHNAFIPQCGLAPGFITIVAHDLAKEFDLINSVKMRVGALPKFPHNKLKYNLTWSTEGLINEYCNPCEVLHNGKLELVPPLEGLETLSIDGDEYEAFNTSGGLGTLAESLVHKVKHMDYKSIRYPGHREILQILLHDLKFIEDREGLKKIFERALPHTTQDVVIIFVTVTGEKNNQYSQKSYAKKIYHSNIGEEHWGAIQITTAAGICAVLDLHANAELPNSGFIRQEEISYDKFIKNRFGKYYS
ncbi:saccharopine dehydrogenase family protein [Pigmentibacter ruber]|uniref:saccharopine dehydrogenase family protein n=1 Tax=Pigmentibacter ruber TaxID=2683196 RepID=UPI00131BD47A|nr:saccharopine dehydrogenase C-terminal domain-containing protein [Pigmentibacter ruber]